jgi:preprotein translocase subunit SecE
MGRLQRKKAPGKKKKKQLSAEKQPASDASDRSIQKKPLLSVAKFKDKNKITVPTQKLSIGAERAAALKKKDNIFNKAIQFLREVKVELKKVAWPTRKQTIGSTVVVIVLVMIISFFLGVVDIGLSSLIRVTLG